MPEPKRLGEFSPEFIKSERELIGQVRTERKGELSDYIAAERPQLKRPEGIPNELDLVRQVMAGRKKEAPVVKEERGALGEFAAGFGRGVLGVVAAPAEIADVAGEAMGWEALEKAGEAGAKAVEKYIEESPKLRRTESISKNILKNPELWKDPRWYSSIVGEGLPTILSMVVPGMAAAKAAKVAKLGAKGVRAARIAGGLTAGVGLEAAGAASGVRQYEEQTGEAVPISTKLQSVLGTGIVAGSLEYVPIFAIFGKPGATKLVGRVLSGMAIEGTTEGAQGLVANAFAKAGYDADRNMVDGVVESIVGGVLLGGGMGAVSRATNFKERVDETNPDEVSDILEQAEKETKVTPERAVELTEAEKRQATIDKEFEARRTPEERQAEIEAAMPATPMTTISEETTKLAEEGIKPAPVEEVVEPEAVPPVEEVVEEPMPAAMRAMGMRPKKAAVPFMITKTTEIELADLGYTKDDVSKMIPEDALGIVEGKIAKEPIVEEKIVEPEIEIPTLTDTTQAMAFGEKATPEQITELKRLRKESEKQYHIFVEEGKNDEAIEEAFRGQLYREAFEAKEKPKELAKPAIEKPPKDIYEAMIREEDAKVTAEISDAVRAEKEYDRIAGLQVDFKEAAAKKGYSAQAQDIIFGDIDQLLFDIDKGRINKEAAVSMYEDAVAKKIAIPEKLDKFKQRLSKLAKPPTPKPPKPKPPEAVREEIEVEPIPEVAPKVEKKEKGELTFAVLNKEVAKYKGTGGIATEAKVHKFKPAFKDQETGKIYPSTTKSGAPAGIHLLEGLPEAVVTSRHEDGEIEGVKSSIVSGFTKNGKFFTRDEAVKEQQIEGEGIEDVKAKPIPEVAPKVEKKEKTGFAWIKGKQKPILSARKITSGKNKGKYEVILTKGRDEEGNIIPGAKKIVTEKHIITMPEAKAEDIAKKIETKKKVIPYFTVAKAKALIQKDILKLSDKQLQKHIVKLRDYERYTKDTGLYRKQLMEGGYFVQVEHPDATGLVPINIWLGANLTTSLNESLAEQKKRQVKGIPVEKAKIVKPIIPGVKPTVEKEKIEVAPTPEGKEITVDLTKKEEAAVTPKQQKTYLLAEVDKAIEEAPKVKPFESLVKEFKREAKYVSPKAYTELLEKQARIGEERVAKYGTVTIHVPDDGVFTILNTKQSLEEFKKKAKKFPAVEPKAKKVIIPGVVRKAPVVETIDELRLTPDGKDYFTDGSIIIKGKPPAGAKYGEKGTTQEQIKGILATKTDPAELKYYAFIDPDFGHGVAKTPVPSGLATPNYSPMAVFQAKSGNLYGYNQFRLNAITKRFPKAKYGIAEEEFREGLLIAVENKKSVAALMPIRTKGENALMEDMAIEKRFIEARPLKKEEEPLFLKRKTATAIGVSKAPSLQKQVDTVTSLWKNAPMVEVIQSQSELPSVILKASKGEIVDGVYYKGKVYIVADNTTSPEAAVKTLLHESFGHYGMRELLGKDFGDIMGKVYIAKRAEVIKIADEYGYDIKSVKDRALAADEWLAREAVSNPESGWVQKVMAAIRQFVRRIMPSLKLSNAEIQKLLEDARTYVERGRPRAEIARTLFEEPGYQVRAFHGGPSMFDKFRTAKIGEGEGFQAIAWGLYFADKKDIAKGYAEKLTEKGKERYLYQVSLHKGKKPGEYDFLAWDKFITPETKDKVLKQLKKEFPDDAKFMVSWDMSYGEGKRGLTGQNLYKQLIEEIANTKNRKAGFEKFRPSDKEASLFLLRAGIDGVKYPAGTITGVKTEGFNYVVFDEEAVSIDERIAFAKRKPVPTKEEKMAKAFKVLGIKPKLKPSEPLPKRARSVGLAYQDISEEAKRLEVEMGLEYPKVTRTHAELREQADRIMGDQEQLIKTMAKEKNFTEAEGLVVRRAAATGLESLMKVVATKDIKKANEMHKTFKEGIGNKLQDLHSEYGKNLESLKEVVSPESMAKAFAGLERDLNKDDMDKFNGAAEALGQGDAKPMINFQKYLKATKQDPQLMDYVYEYWYNSILSGVPTHVVNVASNTAWGAWQVGVHKPLLAAIDPLVAKFQKRPTEYYMAEVIPALAGIKRGFKPGIKGAKEMLLKGYTTNADLDKFAADMGKSVGAFSRSPNKYLKAIAPFLTMPTRALRGMDIWAKQMNYEAELGSIAKRMEKKGEGKYEELLKNPNESMMQEASQYADYTTFMGKLGKIGTQIEKLRTTVPGGRFIMPFVRTIANLVKRGVEMTPGVGAMKLLGGKVKGKEVTQVLVKQIEGAMIALVVASMFDDDEITGDVPANKAEREAFYRQGKKPWSIKVGDTWYQYRRVEPFNTPIAAVGILYDTWKRTGEEPSTEFVYRSAAGFVNNIIDSSYLSGLTQVLDSVRKADKWPQKLTNMFDRTIASFSPMSSFQRSFVRAIEAVDKEGAILRKPKGAVETLAAATPFISEMVPARKDVWGEEVVIEGSPLAQWLPWKAAKATKDVVEKEIERLHGLGLLSYPGMPAKYMSVAGKRLDLDDERYDKLITESGQASKKKLDSLVGTSYWKMLSDKEKASRIQRIIKSDRKRSRNAIKRGLGVGAIPGMVPWKTTAKRKRPAWQEPVSSKRPGWQKSIGF